MGCCENGGCEKGVLYKKGVLRKGSCVNEGCTEGGCIKEKLCKLGRFVLGAKLLVGQSFTTFKAAEELITATPNNS